MYKIHEQLETTEKFDFLTPTRYLIREDTLKELTEEKDKIAGKSHYFLFNDIIMRTKKDKKSIKLETLFVIASTTITDNESRGNTSFCNTFELAQVGSAGRKFTLVCDTYEQKMEWMTDIEQLIRPFQEEYTKEYEKLLDDFDPSKFKRSTIATGNPSAVDSSPKSLMRSATSSGLSTKHLPAVPSKPLPPPPPSHKSNVNLIRSESKSNLNDNNSANTTPNAASPRTSVANVSSSTDSPATTTTPSSRPPSISPRSSLTPPLETSPRTSLHLTTTTTTTTTSSPTTTAEATTTTAAAISKAPLPFIVKPKPPVTLPRKSLNSTNSPVLSSSEQSTPVLNPTTTSTPNIPVSTPLQKLPPRTTESSISSPAFSNFKPAPNVGGRPLPNPANMKPRALPHPTTTSSSPSSANTTPTHSPSLQSTNNNESTATTTTPSPPPKTTTTPTTSSPLVSSPSVNSSASSTPPPVAPRPIAFPKSAAALKNVVPSPVSRSYSTLPSSSSSFSPLSPSSPNSTAPAKDDNQLPAKKTVAPVLPPTQNINKLPPKTVTTAPVIPPRSSAPSTTDSSSNKPLPTPPPTSKPVPPPRR
ncbi:pleckstrin domain-containing protein [Heterostelium album PN500]|uniref:Pleckstrin domain-containing protein n=1 Tax=Heterostelium pallidum (strain ATCC 26659 / Pp 5 / PN500) TaxID=670386 RepID=D3BV89_HETP5|nr:pleckstrin domain-containing protein [Heterostelium album PN500]EFA74646.1 pleckstrin domain-containing protein [Heterostelium album PN500]|eukprot:XP_020426780.1 pleckstrin domain-containing protein [Heterostelium album PN500]